VGALRDQLLQFEIFDDDFDEYVDLDSVELVKEKCKIRVKIDVDRPRILAEAARGEAERLFNQTAGSAYRVTKVEPIDNPRLADATMAYLENMEERRCGGAVFNPKFSECEPAPCGVGSCSPCAAIAAKMLLLGVLRSAFRPDLVSKLLQKANVVPVWHGVSSLVTAQSMTDPAETYGYKLCKWEGKPLKTPFDTHIVRVKKPECKCIQPTVTVAADEFTEVVVKQDAQMLPVAKVFFRKR
jgi:hypothetical protein